jgi:hypothetical protein
MTKQTESANSLVGSSAGIRIPRLFTLTIAATLAVGAVSSLGQQQPPAAPSEKAIPATEKKAPAPPAEKVVGNYTMHSNVELGGVISEWNGSDAMWATMVNEGTGMRMLNQSLEMRTVNPSKTPFFDTLSTASFGYGGEPNDVSYLKFSKGKLYDFSGGFRRDRNYYDYNLMPNSLLSTATPETPVLVPQPSSLHIFNTVRRNTDLLLTLLPVSRFSFRAGYNLNVHEGPTYSTVHYAGDVQVLEMFQNAGQTYIGGVDAKLAKRTTLSYDQFYGYYKGDSTFQLAPTPFTLINGTPVSLGVDVLTGPTVTCGTGANKTQNVINGIANPYCSGTIVSSSISPIRTSFPTEQLRFSSHYWDRVSFNGRFLYSGGTYNVNNFNQTFNGLNTRTLVRQEIETGGMANGRLANNKRANSVGDFGFVADLNKYFSVSDSFVFRDLRTSGYSIMNTQAWLGTSTTSMLTPVSSLTPCTPGVGTCPASPAINGPFLNHENIGNTILGVVTVNSAFKFSGGWRFNSRHIVDGSFDGGIADDLTWHQNGLLLGAVIQPSHVVRVNVNYDSMSSTSANSQTPSNTYTREAPNNLNHIRVRGVVTPAKWINFALTANDFQAKNDDPLVNHREHNHDFSFAAQFIPTETLSLDFNFARDDVFSRTDICYAFTPNVNAPLPVGAVNAGTCTVANSGVGVGDPSYYLGNGYYDAPVTYFAGALSWAPSKYFRYNGGIRLTDTNGTAEFLNPLMVPGALQSKVVSPFSDLLINIAPQWAWHGNWVHHGYDEAGGPGPAPRSFHGDVVTLGVKYAF